MDSVIESGVFRDSLKFAFSSNQIEAKLSRVSIIYQYVCLNVFLSMSTYNLCTYRAAPIAAGWSSLIWISQISVQSWICKISVLVFVYRIYPRHIIHIYEWAYSRLLHYMLALYVFISSAYIRTRHHTSIRILRIHHIHEKIWYIGYIFLLRDSLLRSPSRKIFAQSHLKWWFSFDSTSGVAGKSYC